MSPDLSHSMDSASQADWKVQMRFQSALFCIVTSDSADVRRGWSQRLTGDHTQ